MTHTILVATADPVDLPIARDPDLEKAIRQTLCIQLDMCADELEDACQAVVNCWNHPTLDNLRAALVECLGDPDLLIIHIES